MISGFSAYAELAKAGGGGLFDEWRAFECPPYTNDGAPDYTAATFEKRWPAFLALQARLHAMNTEGSASPPPACTFIGSHLLPCPALYPSAHDSTPTSPHPPTTMSLVGQRSSRYAFNHWVLKPWARDPAYYKCVWTEQSDVPAHEGPTHHRTTELWTYSFPLSASAKPKLLEDLKVIPALSWQARANLTGDAKELWVAGIRDIKTQPSPAQSSDLQDLMMTLGTQCSWSKPEDVALLEAAKKALDASNDLVSWLQEQAPTKTGPSGIGKQQYTWWQQNVHLVLAPVAMHLSPLTWDDEVQLLKRELARAWSALKLEEHKNRKLPPLAAADTPEAYDKLADDAARSLMDFMRGQDSVSVKDYWEPALRRHLGTFLPAEKRHFFWITAHLDPRPLFSHFYHWFELARMEEEPHKSPVRKVPGLYNVWDTRNEGIATACEEIFMQAGLYEDCPRAKELVHILLAQRAARGLGSLYAHANIMTMEEAGKLHLEYTPRGWMKAEKDLLIFEQHLYLRQPGYGTSYIVGKYLLENAMGEHARKFEALTMESDWTVKLFFDEINKIGCIPASLVHWQLTEDDTEVKEIVDKFLMEQWFFSQMVEDQLQLKGADGHNHIAAPPLHLLSMKRAEAPPKPPLLTMTLTPNTTIAGQPAAKPAIEAEEHGA
eukprot:gene10865-1973_t